MRISKELTDVAAKCFHKNCFLSREEIELGINQGLEDTAETFTSTFGEFVDIAQIKSPIRFQLTDKNEGKFLYPTSNTICAHLPFSPYRAVDFLDGAYKELFREVSQNRYIDTSYGRITEDDGELYLELNRDIAKRIIGNRTNFGNFLRRCIFRLTWRLIG